MVGVLPTYFLDIQGRSRNVSSDRHVSYVGPSLRWLLGWDAGTGANTGERQHVREDRTRACRFGVLKLMDRSGPRRS
jgi:hypothetical protein